MNFGKIETVVGNGTEIKGNIVTKGTIRVDGRVEGEIISEEGVVVGETGIVRGDLTGKSVIVGGKVTGDVSSHSTVELLPTAQLVGDVRAVRLVIAEGVVFDGNCETVKDKSEGERKNK